MPNYQKRTDASGKVRYFDEDGKGVKGSEVPEDAKATLDASSDGEFVDDEGNTVEVDDGSQEPVVPADQEPVPANFNNEGDEGTPDRVVDSGLQQDEAGMGFPRRNGSTVDVFDGKTPHTHVRNVGGLMVPLSEENYNKKTDSEIQKQLDKLRKNGSLKV
jgi:hypothetical protein